MALVLSCNIEQHWHWAKETTVSNTYTVLAVSNIKAHKYERQINLEWGFDNNCTTNIHKGMYMCSNVWWGPFQKNDERTTPKAFISKIQQSDGARTMGCQPACSTRVARIITFQASWRIRHLYHLDREFSQNQVYRGRNRWFHSPN